MSRLKTPPGNLALRCGVALVLLASTSVRVFAAENSATMGLAGGCDASLQSLVDATPPGGVVNVRPCVYRETVTVNKPISLIGQAGAEIRGSDVWSAWIPSNTLWISQQSVPALPIVSKDPNACEAGSDHCLRPQEVFLDGLPLALVGPGATPAASQFALDGGSHVVLADNPVGHVVEVATRPRWLVTGADGVTIQGMTMRHAANSALVGAISNDGHSNWTLQDSTLSDAHAADVSLDGGSDVRILHNDVGNAGLVGVAANAVAHGGVVQANRLHDNRTADAAFNRDWGAGGLKLTHVQAFLIDGNEVDHNDGIGLWCDIDCTNVTFSNNRVHHNQWQGVNFEISNGASIHDNALWENGWGKAAWGWGAGIVISSSANAEVFNNTAAWNYAGISVIWQKRPDSPGPNPVGNYVHDNTVIKKTVTGDFSQTYWQNLSLAWLSDGSAPLYDAASNNRGAANWVWYDTRENQSVRFAWTDQYFRLAKFTDTPGGADTRYLTDADKEQILTDHAMPAAPEGPTG